MKWLLRVFVVVLILVGGFFLLAPMVVENVQNQNEIDYIEPKAETVKLHQQLFIADMHADSLLWDRNLLQRAQRGHVDIPRLQEGNVALQFFTIVTKSPKNLNIQHNKADSDNITLLTIAQRWPIATWKSLYERAKYQTQKLQQYQRQAPDQFMLIKSQAEIQSFLLKRKTMPKLVGGILGLEGAHAIEENLETHLQSLYDLGVRMMAPTHFFDNQIAGSQHGSQKNGLTILGKRFIQLANEKHIILDMAHASEQTILDSLQISQQPMVVSHTGLRGHCNTPRNIPDDLAKEIVQRGGLIAIGFWSTAICGSTTDAVAEAIIYAVKLLGEDAVALGSDYDGAVAVPFQAHQMSWLTQKLLDKGLSYIALEKVMGLNVQKFLLKNLP